MKTSTASAVLPCTPETFWAAFLDESYLSALYLEELEYRAFAVIEIGETSRKLRIVPKYHVSMRELQGSRTSSSPSTRTCTLVM
jgi:hypothetical protein